MSTFSGALLLLFGLIVPSLSQSGTPCPLVPGRPSCVCQSPKGIIDLTSISNTDGTARFTGLQDPNDYSYSYNPCQPFKGDYDCSTVHICQVSNYDPTQTFDIADPNTERMYIDTDGTPYVYYTGPENRVVKVFLHCVESQGTTTATTDGDSDVLLNYVFDITGKAVCPGGGGGGGVAPGEIGFVILFVILPLGIATYIILGVLIMKYRFNASGKDLIPNRGFWFAFPFLVKDGVLFTFSPLIGLIKGKVSQSKEGYENLG